MQARRTPLHDGASRRAIVLNCRIVKVLTLFVVIIPRPNAAKSAALRHRWFLRTEDDLPPIFSPGITRLSPDLGAPTLHLQIRFHHLKSRLRTAKPCERSRTKPRSSAQTPRA